MKRYLNLQHPSQGRALAYDDFEALEELALFPQAILHGMGDCVVDGCELDTTQGRLYAGIVWLNGRLYDFDGDNLHDSTRNVDRKFLVVAPAATDDPRPTVGGGTVPGLRRESVVLTDTVATGQHAIQIDNPQKTIRLTNRWQERLRAPGTIEWLANVSSTDYDSTGRGLGNALGWALCNGNPANGVIDLRGRFVLGHNPSSYVNGNFSATSVNDTGGAERVALGLSEMPRHTHSTNTQSYYGNITYDSGDSDGHSPDWNKRSSPTIGYAGGNSNNDTDAHQNMPPYYVLVARQWIGL